MNMQPIIRHSQEMRERARQKKGFIVTVGINGKPIGDDSCTVQAVVDKAYAQKMLKVALELMHKRKEK